MKPCTASSTRRIRRAVGNGRVSAVSVAPDAKLLGVLTASTLARRLVRRLTAIRSQVQNERARSEHPRPRKGLRLRPRSIRTSRSIVLFQPGADAGTRKRIRMPGTSDPYAAFRLNLEQQRKRAKDLLRAVRAGHAAARRP